MNSLLLGIIIGTLWQIVFLWLVFSLKESLPKALKTYANAWKIALKINGNN